VKNEDCAPRALVIYGFPFIFVATVVFAHRSRLNTFSTMTSAVSLYLWASRPMLQTEALTGLAEMHNGNDERRESCQQYNACVKANLTILKSNSTSASQNNKLLENSTQEDTTNRFFSISMTF